MLRIKQIRVNGVCGTRYHFTQAGDGIPMHKHPPELAHTTEVLSGSVLMTDSAGSRTLRPGKVESIDWANLHQIEALEPETVIVNWFLCEQHEGFEDWPEFEEESQLVKG